MSTINGFYIYQYQCFLVAQWSRIHLPMQETQVRSLGQEDSLEKERQPTPVFLPGKSHGQRSLVGCIAWDCKSQTQLSEHAPKINLGTYALNQGKLFSPFRTSPNHRDPSLHWDVRTDIQVESHPHIWPVAPVSIWGLLLSPSFWREYALRL